jgi:Protein kinase domain
LNLLVDSYLPPIDAQYRSPEEYEWSRDLTEKIDVYNLGQIFFTLLTGHFITDDEAKQERRALEKGGAITIDPRYKERSKVEAKLVEIIEWCQERKREDRPSVFELIEELKDVLQIAKQEEKGKTQAGPK